MLTMSDIKMRLNCDEIGRVNWNELKTYFKNKYSRDDLVIRYIDDENEEVSLDNDDELSYAYGILATQSSSIYVFAKDPTNGEMIGTLRINLLKPFKSFFDMNSNMPNHFETKSSVFNSNDAPNWFTQGLEKFKSEILQEFDKRIEQVFIRMQTMQFSREMATDFQTDVQSIVQNLFKELDDAFLSKSDTKIRDLCEKIRTLEAYDAQFVRDCNILDGTKLRPNVPFRKSWLIKNTGKLRWNLNEIKLVNIAGDIIALEKCVNVTPVDTNDIVEIQVELKAPNEPGQYFSEWILMCKNYSFGPRIWCKIDVIDNLIDLSTSNMTLNKREASIYDLLETESIDLSEFEDAKDDDAEFVIIPECFDLTKKWLPKNFTPVNSSRTQSESNYSTKTSINEPQKQQLQELLDEIPTTFKNYVEKNEPTSFVSEMPSIQTISEQPKPQEQKESFLIGTPQFSYTFNDDNFMRPLVEKVFETCNAESPMNKLIRMGFANRDLNRKLLEKHNDNLEKVIEELVHFDDNDWAYHRH